MWQSGFAVGSALESWFDLIPLTPVPTLTMSAVDQADLFPASGSATPRDIEDEAPVASGSRSPEVKRSASPNDEDASDDGDLVGPGNQMFYPD